MELHFLSGYSIIALLLFRVAWGFVGSETARFSHFLKSPLAALRHLARLHRREPDTEIGHNAAGGWMVLVMLVLLAVQVGDRPVRQRRRRHRRAAVRTTSARTGATGCRTSMRSISN